MNEQRHTVSTISDRLFRLVSDRVFVIGLVLLLLGIFTGARGYFLLHRTFDFQEFVGDFYANASTELISIAITILVVDRAYKAQERQRTFKENLIIALGSRIADVSTGALRELRRYGWLEDGSLRGVDLTGANLQNADLHYADLSFSILNEANLRRANLRGAKLNEASIDRSLLDEAMLDQTDLRNSSIVASTLKGASLRYANLQSANLNSSNLGNADLTEANLTNASLLNAIMPDGSLYNNDENLE